MALNKYFQDELSFLREMGREFSAHHPKLSRFLSESGDDPDVERLLEGFAFLTGRLREKLEDELPELSHSLISLLWPHYLRPLPSMTIMQFFPINSALSSVKVVERGTTITGPPVEGTQCIFQTCYDIEMAPLELIAADVTSTRAQSNLHLTFETQGQTSVKALELKQLRLHLSGDLYITQSLYLWMQRYLDHVHISVGEQEKRLPASAVKPVGFVQNEGLLPYPPNAFNGYRFLQEYFSLPEKFLFLDITNLRDILRDIDDDVSSFKISFVFNRTLDPHIRVRNTHFRLFCSPAINLFPHDADPIRLDRRRVDYRVRPSGREQSHYAVYSVDSVEGSLPNGGGLRSYPPFESFEHGIEGAHSQEQLYYQLKVRQSVSGEGMDHFLSFVNGGDLRRFPDSETISLSLTCCNRSLPEKLPVGAISLSSGDSPSFATFHNITKPTAFVVPPLDSRLQWQLISNMSLNYLSLTSPEPLRMILSAYDFPALNNRQAERAAQQRLKAIKSVKAVPLDLLYEGLPVRGVRTTLELSDEHFAGEGDMFVFATVLAEFLSLYASINSFHQLVVKNTVTGEEYRWMPKVGQQPVL
jgi:type VI secretion system protein ImpG